MQKNDLAVKIAPIIAKQADADKLDLLQKVGFLKRSALKLAWPMIMFMIPYLTGVAIGSISAAFGTMNVNDLLAFLATQVKENPGVAEQLKETK